MNLPPAAEGHAIVLFDGVCHFCCTSVQFIIARDPAGFFKFASQQSDLGRGLLTAVNLTTAVETIVLIQDGVASTRSDAALKIASRLAQPWPLCRIFQLLPRFLRDAIYNFVARNRHRWFGRRETCWMPGPEIRKRFLDLTNPT